MRVRKRENPLKVELDLRSLMGSLEIKEEINTLICLATSCLVFFISEFHHNSSVTDFPFSSHIGLPCTDSNMWIIPANKATLRSRRKFLTGETEMRKFPGPTLSFLVTGNCTFAKIIFTWWLLNFFFHKIGQASEQQPQKSRHYLLVSPETVHCKAISKTSYSISGFPSQFWKWAD